MTFTCMGLPCCRRPRCAMYKWRVRDTRCATRDLLREDAHCATLFVDFGTLLPRTVGMSGCRLCKLDRPFANGTKLKLKLAAADDCDVSAQRSVCSKVLPAVGALTSAHQLTRPNCQQRGGRRGMPGHVCPRAVRCWGRAFSFLFPAFVFFFPRKNEGRDPR